MTRRRIMEAARDLFIARGYAGATMEVIADQADVAVETVYAAFGSKSSILSRVFRTSLLGDDEPVSLFDRDGPQRVIHEKDQTRQVELFAPDITAMMGRVAPLFEVMRTAAKTEPDIAAMMGDVLAERVEGMKFFINGLLSNGPLREGVTVQSAAETVWALSSGEV